MPAFIGVLQEKGVKSKSTTAVTPPCAEPRRTVYCTRRCYEKHLETCDYAAGIRARGGRIFFGGAPAMGLRGCSAATPGHPGPSASRAPHKPPATPPQHPRTHPG